MVCCVFSLCDYCYYGVNDYEVVKEDWEVVFGVQGVIFDW